MSLIDVLHLTLCPSTTRECTKAKHLVFSLSARVRVSGLGLLDDKVDCAARGGEFDLKLHPARLKDMPYLRELEMPELDFSRCTWGSQDVG